MTSRTRQAEARERILDAARTLFVRNGFEDTTMEEIARAARYTRRTLYAHFRGREEICLVVLTNGLRLRWERQRAAMAAATTGLGQIRAWGEGLYLFSREQPHDLRLQSYWDYRGIDRRAVRASVFRRFRLLNEEIVAGLRAAFETGERDATIRPGLPIDLTINQYALTLRAVLNKALFPGYSFAPAGVEAAFRHYLDLFIRSISQDAPGGAMPGSPQATPGEE